MENWLKRVLDAYLVPGKVYQVADLSIREYFLKVAVPLFVPAFLIPVFNLLSGWFSGTTLYGLILPTSYIVATLALVIYIETLRVCLYLMSAPESKKVSEIAVYTLPFLALTPLGLLDPRIGLANLIFAIPYQGFLVARVMRRDQTLDLEESTELARKFVYLSYTLVFLPMFLYMGL